MKIQITKRTELMMAQAVALAQNGRMKSHIHGSDSELYVANMDNTIIISFTPDMADYCPAAPGGKIYQRWGLPRLPRPGTIQGQVVPGI